MRKKAKKFIANSHRYNMYIKDSYIIFEEVMLLVVLAIAYGFYSYKLKDPKLAGSRSRDLRLHVKNLRSGSQERSNLKFKLRDLRSQD